MLLLSLEALSTLWDVLNPFHVFFSCAFLNDLMHAFVVYITIFVVSCVMV